MRFSQPSVARQINRLRVLNAVAQHDLLSRADVARLLELNKVSTSEIVDTLIREGLIVETGSRTTEKGRPPINLTLHKDAHMVLAIDVGTLNTKVALVNLGGEIKRVDRFPTQKNPRPEELAAILIEHVQRFLSKMKDKDLVMGIAISLAGEIDAVSQTITIPQWEWLEVPLQRALETHISYPIVLANNVYSMLLGERWFYPQKEYNSIYYVNWAQHINAALFTEGRILTHSSLLGHIPINKEKTCRCGAVGCLETTASGWALVEPYNNGMTVKQLVSLSETEPKVEEALLRATDDLTHALVTAASVTQAETIILGGGISSLPDRFMDRLMNTFQKRVSSYVNTTIQKSQLGDQAGVLGTASVALDNFLFRRTFLEQIKTASPSWESGTSLRE